MMRVDGTYDRTRQLDYLIWLSADQEKNSFEK